MRARIFEWEAGSPRTVLDSAEELIALKFDGQLGLGHVSRLVNFCT
jgi:hypothetical protein